MTKKKALIYGAGQNLTYFYPALAILYEIVGIVDKYKAGECFQNIRIIAVDEIVNISFDVIIVTLKDNSETILKLQELGIPDNKIIIKDRFFDEAYEGNQIRLAVIFYGGMGDFLIGKNWLYYLIKEYSLETELWDAYLDNHTYDMGKWIFEDDDYIDSVNSIHCGYDSLRNESNYDVVFRFCITPYLQFFDAEKIGCINPKFLDYLLQLQQYGLKNYCIGFCHNSRYHSVIRKMMDAYPERQYHNYCDLFENLNIGENFIIRLNSKTEVFEYLEKNGLENKKFITLDTGQNLDYKNNGNTRAWAHSYWNKLSILLKKRFAEYKIVQVGEKMSEQDDIEADVHLNGKTHIEDAIVLMKSALIHIDYDGGLVHLRHILNGGASVVLFGPSAVSRHSYSENIAISAGVCGKDCEWKTEDWLINCPLGTQRSECMMAITPEMVFERIEKFIGRTK